ncbi:transposase [Bradyrhizobium sp. CCBAU 51753]|uniref:IS91 family transposase n=1 Tax=Bradyrhizobium sp. CCBAU 51753 TaxID=1325100 RepID=UPI0021132BFB|nr:transposase [Bradyrhizobium sp. CCBAU 51753]
MEAGFIVALASSSSRSRPSRLYRRLFLERLQAAFDSGKLRFFGHLAHFVEPAAFGCHPNALRKIEGVVYAKCPFGGPEQVLAYLGLYTQRVAIVNGRLLSCEHGRVRFRWNDYRAGNKPKVMTLKTEEFIRRFLLHILRKGFRRIRHFSFLASACRAAKLTRIRAALEAPQPPPPAEAVDYRERCAILFGHRLDLCPICGGRMVEIGPVPHAPTQRRAAPHCDTS